MEEPASQGVEQPVHVIELLENARVPIPWTLSVYPERWVFETANQPPTTFTRDNLRKWVDVDTLATFGMLPVTLDKKKIFPLKPGPRALLQAWLGPPTRADLVIALGKRYSTASLVLAAVMVLFATPWFMPAWLAPTGADPKAGSFDPVLIAWGASTLVGWAIAKLMPHRALFLIDLVVQLGLAAWWAYGVAIGERSWWLALLIGLMFFGASVSHKHYKRFATMQP